MRRTAHNFMMNTGVAATDISNAAARQATDMVGQSGTNPWILFIDK
jgi:hypothetical protein